jgi:hypothetical protein
MCLRGESRGEYFKVRNGKLTSDKENFVMRKIIISTTQGTLFVGESPKENNTGGKCRKLLTPELNPSAQRCLTRFFTEVLFLEPAFR